MNHLTREQYLALPIATDLQITEATVKAREYIRANSNYSSARGTAELAIIEYYLYTHYGVRLQRGE